jgi:hypothetical protein
VANHLRCHHSRHPLSGIQVFPSSLAIYHLSDLLTELFIWGVAPKRRGTFVSAKVPKTIFARARPHGGSSASVPNKMARELAALKQPSPISRFGKEAPPRPKAREK